MECRRLLAGDIELRFDITDDAGLPVSSVEVGSEFSLDVYVRDSGDSDGGVTSAFLDVTYNGQLASPAGPLVHGPEYQLIADGSLETPGLIDEAGGNATNFPAPRDIDAEHLLFRVPFRADATGTLTFTPDPADDFGSGFLAFTWRPRIPLQDVELVGSFSVPIVPASTRGDEAAFSLSGDSTVSEGSAAGYTVGYRGALSAGQSASVDISLFDEQTTAADHAQLAEPIAAAPAAASGVSFDAGTVTFTAGGDVALHFALDTIDDDQLEEAERYRLEIANARGSAGVTTSIVTGTVGTEILDNDPVDTGPNVAYTVVVTDESGSQLPQDEQGRYEVRPGETFWARVFVDDLRSEPGSQGGVFSAFADLLLSDPQRVDWLAGSLRINDVIFPNAQSGRIQTGGVVDEAGGGADAAPLGVDPERLLFEVRAEVSPTAGAGSLSLSLDPADAPQGAHDTLVRGISGQVDATYQSVELVVLEEPPQGPAWQNPDNPLDVNRDGAVTLLDLMLILDDIDLHGMRLLPDPPVPPDEPDPTPGIPGTARYLDVNGDRGVSLLDAQAIADVLNAAPAAVADAETIPAANPSSDFVAEAEPGAIEERPAELIPAADAAVAEVQAFVVETVRDAVIREFADVDVDPVVPASTSNPASAIDQLPRAQRKAGSDTQLPCRNRSARFVPPATEAENRLDTDAWCVPLAAKSNRGEAQEVPTSVTQKRLHTAVVDVPVGSWRTGDLLARSARTAAHQMPNLALIDGIFDRL